MAKVEEEVDKESLRKIFDYNMNSISKSATGADAFFIQLLITIVSFISIMGIQVRFPDFTNSIHYSLMLVGIGIIITGISLLIVTKLSVILYLTLRNMKIERKLEVEEYGISEIIQNLNKERKRDFESRLVECFFGAKFRHFILTVICFIIILNVIVLGILMYWVTYPILSQLYLYRILISIIVAIISLLFLRLIIKFGYNKYIKIYAGKKIKELEGN